MSWKGKRNVLEGSVQQQRCCHTPPDRKNTATDISEIWSQTIKSSIYFPDLPCVFANERRPLFPNDQTTGWEEVVPVLRATAKLPPPKVHFFLEHSLTSEPRDSRLMRCHWFPLEKKETSQSAGGSEVSRQSDLNWPLLFLLRASVMMVATVFREHKLMSPLNIGFLLECGREFHVISLRCFSPNEILSLGRRIFSIWK